MRRLDKLLFNAIVPPFLITLAVLSFVVSIHEFGSLSELLISKNSDLVTILKIIGVILPDILIYSLPISFLIGILIGLGGLSGESQILALRACGVSLRSLLRFIFKFGIMVAILTGLLSLVVLPRTNDLRREIVDQISFSIAPSMIQARVFNEEFPNIVFYLNDLSENKKSWSGLFLADNSDPKNINIMLARSATWINDPDNQRIQLHLENGASYTTSLEDPSKDRESFFGSTENPRSLNKNSAASGSNPRPKKPKELKTSDLLNYNKGLSQENKFKQIVELNRRIALPLAIIPFSLLGLSLAIGTPKSGRTLGFGLGLITVVLFYMLFANGIRLASVGKMPPWLGPWLADFILSLLGLFLLAKVEKRFALSHTILSGRWQSEGAFHRLRFVFERWHQHISGLDSLTIQLFKRTAHILFPKVLDLYILRGFLIHFFWSLVSCSTLFLLLTLFELLDDIIRNSIPVLYLIEYLFFLTPQILLVAIPMSVLLAVLINLGILEKDSEITALKACGCSLYRLALPIFLMAAALSLGLFVMQDYMLPHANDRQDSLRNYIQKKPPKSSKRLQRKWILGESSRIYNYEYFDGNKDSFIDLNIFDVDLLNGRMLRRIHASHATIKANGDWLLENGWVRDYQPAQSGFEKITTRLIRFPENAEYFKKEIFQPKESSKLTYHELNQYINNLKSSGYNIIELQVELNKKISFPLSCLVMAFIGMPFAFHFGKKGAFFGIGVSLAIAICYWGTSGAFEAMGAYGLLIPILAAWAPNMFFAAAGLILFLNLRT
jgi:LPS export ABC transporter permease LptG/LPS export ABC transporter permease LptF